MLRAVGLPVVLTSTLTIALTLEITNNATNIILNNTDAAWNTIAAGRYRFPDFLALVDDAVRRWLFSAIAANGGSGAANVGTKNDKSITWTLAQTPGSDTGILTMVIAGLSATISGTNARIRLAGLNRIESSGAVNWGTLLGLCFETETTRDITESVAYPNTIATIVGRHQSRYIHIIERSEVDSLAKEKLHYYKGHRLNSGKVKPFKFGGQHTERQINFVDQDYQMAMPSITFGRIATIGGARDTITFNAPYLGGVNVSDLYFDETFFRDGSYIEFETFRTRAEYAAGAYGATTIKLMEKIPTSISVVAGKPVKLVSDLWFIWKEAISLGSLQYFYSTDAGDLAWIHDSYLPYGSNEPVLSSDRNDAGVPLYDVQFNLIEVENDECNYITIA